MAPCGCSGSSQTIQRPGPVRQASPSQVPGGPGEPGYTWNGPKKAARPAPVESGSTAKKRS